MAIYYRLDFLYSNETAIFVYPLVNNSIFIYPFGYLTPFIEELLGIFLKTFPKWETCTKLSLQSVPLQSQSPAIDLIRLNSQKVLPYSDIQFIWVLSLFCPTSKCSLFSGFCVALELQVIEKIGLSKLLWVCGVAIVFLQLITSSFGWGEHGHYVTCKIAEAYLSENAMAVVKELLPESAEGELANVCSWADDVRPLYNWSRELHFADTPDFSCNYDYSRDCHDSAGCKNRCVTGATYNYTMQLKSACHNPASYSRYNLTEALMFLSHFVGDVHQPLHCGFLGDLGGNKILLHWYQSENNLHRVWDTKIIDTALKNFYGKWSNYVESWEACDAHRKVCPNPYASESISLACNFAYKNATPGSVLGDDYFLSRLPIVERRLAQGGIRLAATLNRIFSSCGLISNAGKGSYV